MKEDTFYNYPSHVLIAIYEVILDIDALSLRYRTFRTRDRNYEFSNIYSWLILFLFLIQRGLAAHCLLCTRLLQCWTTFDGLGSISFLFLEAISDLCFWNKNQVVFGYLWRCMRFLSVLTSSMGLPHSVASYSNANLRCRNFSNILQYFSTLSMVYEMSEKRFCPFLLEVMISYGLVFFPLVGLQDWIK